MGEIFLGNEALADGLRRRDLRRWYRPLFRGVYIPKNARPTLADRAVGAWLTSGRQGIVAGVTASAMHGARWVDDDEPIEILVHDRRRQAGLLVRTDRIDTDEVVTIDGIPVTSAARTAFDLGRYLKRTHALARLDALMRVAPFGDDVHLLIQRYGPVRGVRQLRELLPLVDAGAESPKESWLRLLLIDNGFPIPETQIPVFDDGPQPFAFLDMGWREVNLAIEYDGDQHRTDRPQYVKDLRRIPRIERCGYHVIRVIAEDSPAEILGRVYEAWLHRGGAEIDEMSAFSRTNRPIRPFGREVA